MTSAKKLQTKLRNVEKLNSSLSSSDEREGLITVQPLSRTHNSQSQRDFKVLKSYIKKGLTDILDRDVNRKICSVNDSGASPSRSNLNKHDHARAQQMKMRPITSWQKQRAARGRVNIRCGSQTRLEGKITRMTVDQPSHDGGHVIPDEHTQMTKTDYFRQIKTKDHYLDRSSDKLFSMLKEGDMQKVWRNAYFLSTSVEEDTMRQIQPQQFTS